LESDVFWPKVIPLSGAYCINKGRDITHSIA